MDPAPIVVVSGPAGVGKSTVSHMCASSFDQAVHMRTDEFMGFVVSGWVDPWLADAAHQHHVAGGALGAASIEFARGGYTVFVDGHYFPGGVEGFAAMSARREVPLHYVVLQADLETCLTRASGRGRVPDVEQFELLHERFSNLGPYEQNVIDAAGSPDEVAAAVLAAIESGSVVMERT